MSMSTEQKKSRSAQRLREKEDPNESNRPLPWFLVMSLGAMAMWGAFYIYSTPSGENSAYGDQRTVADLRPAVVVAGGAPTIDGKQLYGAKCAACHQGSGFRFRLGNPLGPRKPAPRRSLTGLSCPHRKWTCLITKYGKGPRFDDLTAG